MNRVAPFNTKAYCDICNQLGSYNFMGDYLCEKCYREDQDRDSYDDEINDNLYCHCDDSRCGKKEEYFN